MADPKDQKKRRDVRKMFDPKQGDWDDVILRHMEYLQFYPKSSIAFYNLGFAFAQRDQVGNAETAFKKALEINPEMAEVLVNLGGLAYGQKRWQECIEYNRKALELRPDLVQAKLNIGFAYMLLEEKEEAKKIFEEILEENPKAGNAHYGLAVLYKSLDNLELSRKYFQRSVSLGVQPDPEFVKLLEDGEK